MEAAAAKPPYVRFEVRSIEDRNATIKSGHYVGIDKNYAIITPQGSKDQIEKIADEWLTDLEAAVREDRFPREWLRMYKNVYTDWKDGREIPLEGTPILTWPAISPSQQKACLDQNIRTVEDLSEANESTLSGIGMGARALKERAKAWIESASTTGKTAEELSRLRADNARLEATVEKLEGQVRTLNAKVKELELESA